LLFQPAEENGSGAGTDHAGMRHPSDDWPNALAKPVVRAEIGASIVTPVIPNELD